jgi:peptidoglycan/LPS O-acetylase OafA/YrhL
VSAPAGTEGTRASGAAPAGPTLGYLPGLDGIRAIAVLGVVVYHVGKVYRGGWQSWLSGGFLGVEVFFVISGYLITSLLLAETQRTGRIDYKDFWLRRARRLLPALYLLIAVLVGYLALVADGELAGVRHDLLAAFGYVTNWFLIADGRSYFEVTQLFPIEHLWSLAIEEQWYLLWPVAFALGVRVLGRRPLVFVGVLVALAGLSSALMHAGYSTNGASKVYWGTHTRASGLLLGAALALVWAPWRLRSEQARAAQTASTLPAWRFDALGFGALALLLVYQRSIDEYDVSLWQWSGPRPSGFILVDLLTLVLIASAVHPQAQLLDRALRARWLGWCGTRSYGLYLWHWPILVLVGPRTGLDISNRWLLLAIQVALTLAITEASFRYVETPIRHGAIGQAIRRAKEAPDRDRSQTVGAGIGVALFGTVALLTVTVAQAEAPEDPNRLPSAVAVGEEGGAVAATASTPTPAPTSPADGEVATPGPTVAATPPPANSGEVTPATPTGPPFAAPVNVTVVGDSVGKLMFLNFPAAVGASVTPSDGTIEGCGIVDTATMSSSAPFRRDLRGDCADFANRFAAAASGYGAQIVLVTIGAWEVFDMETDDGTATFGSPEHDALLRSGLERTIAALLPTGAQIALLRVPCFSPVDGGGLIALPERGDRARTDHLNGLLAEHAAANPDRVFLVDPPAAFCDDPAAATDLNLRWDGVHYGPAGGELIWTGLAPQLLAIPQP